MSISTILVVLAIVCFVLAAFRVPSPVDLVAAGLTLLSLTLLV